MCLRTKKLFLSFSVRNKDDIFNAFLIPSTKFSNMTPPEMHSLFSLHSHMKKLVRLTMTDRYGLFLFIPGRIAKSQNFSRSMSEVFRNSGRIFFQQFLCTYYYGDNQRIYE
jgi:hypothetical protein